MFVTVAYVLASYFFGSLPLIFLLGKRRGVDLRHAGTGNIGGSNLWKLTGPTIGTLGLAGDLTKGLLPPALAMSLDLGSSSVAASAVATVVGQMWPVFLRFNGGRGNLTALGALGIVAPGALIVGAIPIAFGVVLKLGQLAVHRGRPDVIGVAVGMLLGFLTMAIAAWTKDYPSATTAAVTLIVALLLVRRVTAGLPEDWRRPFPQRWSILWTRLVLDRPHV